ncbi:MAG: phosphohistidine phosphatase SixA [PVC group bacterium]
MKLYLVRHGEPQAMKKDPEQRLTKRGRLDVAVIGRFLEQNGLSIPEIWHSEKARVRETAEIIAQAAGITRLLERPGLAPLDPVGPVRADIIDREEDLLLVGHLPFLSRLANLLLGCPEESQIFRFKPGEVVGLEQNGDGSWQVLFSICPRLLE